MKAKLRLWLMAYVQLVAAVFVGTAIECTMPRAVRAESSSSATRTATRPTSKPDLFDVLAENESRAVAEVPAIAPNTDDIQSASPDDESAKASVTAEAAPEPSNTAPERVPDLFDLLAEQEARQTRSSEANADRAGSNTAPQTESETTSADSKVAPPAVTDDRTAPSTADTVAADAIAPANAAPPPQAAPAEAADSESVPSSTSQVAPSTTDIKTLSPTAPNEVRILSPQEDASLERPAASIVLQFAVGAQVELRVNDELVDINLIGRTETDSSTDIVLQTWYGVSFQPGFNTLSAQATVNGEAGPEVTRTIKVAGGAESIHVETLEARIPADGRTTATVSGELRDANNLRSRVDATITLNASAGRFVGADHNPDQPGFQVRAVDGRFEAQLQASNAAKIASIQAVTTGMEAFTRIEFSTYLRPSIATGVLDFRIGNRGTNFFDGFRDFLPIEGDYSSEFDFYGAGFATGPIGDWLFTGAFNSDRTLNREGDNTTRLFRGPQTTEQTYPVYGDSSTTEYTTPSKDSLYLRLERSPGVPGAPADFLMWGDYNTEEFALRSQQFSAVSRNLHGFKTNFTFGNFQLTGLFSDDTDGFQRDTIAPDGTSGTYFLSQQLVVPGSEQVTLELEELLRPGTVVQRVVLTRGIDYDIDYDRGSLVFRQPLLRTEIARDIEGIDDGITLERKLVATYQFESDGGNTSIYGGRLVYHFSRDLERESWLGSTYFKENQGTRQFELYGADARIALGTDNEILAEFAHSTNDSDVLGEVSGSAFSLEFNGSLSEQITSRAYWRTADPGFVNDATTSFVPGQTRFGAELRADFSANTTFRLQYDREENFGRAPQVITNLFDALTPLDAPLPGQRVSNSLTTITAGVVQRIGDAELQADYVYRDREDRLATQPLDSASSQLRTRVSAPITNKLTFRALNELSLSDEEDIVYPDRTQIGLDWEIAEDLAIGVAQNWISSGQFGSQNYTSLEIVGNRRYDDNSNLSGRYGITSGINGVQGQGTMGLNHRWALAPGLFADVSYERVTGGYFGVTGAGTQFPTPFITGQGASALGISGGESYSIGLEYTDNPDLKATARFEERSSSSGSNTVISANIDGKLSPSLTGLLRYQQANSASQNLDRLGDTIDLRLGLAYRNPDHDKFNALLRYEYRKNPSIIPETLLLGRGTGSEEHLFALEAIYAPNWRWELYGKYAFRDSTSYLANAFVNNSTVTLGQLRATYRLGFNWDILTEVRWISQPSANYSETGFVTELGYYLNPNLRFALGYSMGEIDDPDFSGSRNGNGLYVGMTVKVNELFNGFGLQKVAPVQQGEATLAAESASTEPASQALASEAATARSPQSSEAEPLSPEDFVPKIDLSAVLDPEAEEDAAETAPQLTRSPSSNSTEAKDADTPDELSLAPSDAGNRKGSTTPAVEEVE
ncbi:MAG: TonB-dependent receptor [Cyanobacteria bacterium J06642_2]